LAGFKLITADQMNQTQKKIHRKISNMLDFLDQYLGQPDNPNQNMLQIYVYEMYSIFTHAVEEYGKLLYMKSLIQDANGKYDVNYRYKFRDHTTKFNLALADLPKSINVVYPGGFTKMSMNVLNVDLDDNNDPTDIEFDMDIDMLRKCVFDFRNHFI
jgi:hypothetical protein